MKEMDPMRITVEKNKYAKEGVRKGMYGWICLNDRYNGYWSVTLLLNAVRRTRSQLFRYMRMIWKLYPL